MTIHMSEEQARKAGLLGPKRKTKSTREKGGRGGARSRCSCGEEFISDTAETAHISVGHAKFVTVYE